MKRIISIGLMLAAFFTLTNCTKTEINNPKEPQGIPFTIQLQADTKTVIDGEAIKWVTGDQITVFHAKAGTTDYVKDSLFTLTDITTGTFTGTLGGALTETHYDWYFLYPYVKQIVTPANTSKGWTPIGSKRNEVQTQSGYDNLSHLVGSNFPLTCKVANVAKVDTPTATMKQIASVAKITVTNTTTTPLTVEKISFKGSEDIVGTYYIDFTKDTPTFTSSGANYVDSTANLTVTGGTPLAKNESAIFYIGIKPFTAAAGSTLEIKVNDLLKKVTLSNDKKFLPGKFASLSFDYDTVPTPPPAGQFDCNVDWTHGANSYDCGENVSSVNGITVNKMLRVGKSSEVGNATITIPDGATKLEFYCVGWTGKQSVAKITIGTDEFIINPAANTGATGNHPYHLVNIIDTDKFTYTIPSGVTSIKVETLYGGTTGANDKRVIFAGIKAFTGSALLPQNLSFDNPVVTKDISDAPFTITVNGAQPDATVTYSSDNTDVAEVNNSGLVTLKGITGTAIITANASKTDTHYSGSASYTLNVNDSAATTVTVEKTSFTKGSDEGSSSAVNIGTTGVITYTTDKGDGTTAAFITTNKELRLYQAASGKTSGGTITIEAKTGYTIKSVTIEAVTNPPINYTINGGTTFELTSNHTINGSYTATADCTSLTFYNMATEKVRLDISKISVTYVQN